MITVTGTCENKIAVITADRGTRNPSYCDIPVEQHGQNAYLRPGETLLGALGACMNITARKILDRDGLPYESVTVRVAMEQDGDTTRITTGTEITGALSEADRARVLEEVRACPVCQILSGRLELTLA